LRRHDRQINNKVEIEAIIEQAQVCRIGLSENNTAYVIPVNFGYSPGCLYFHCAREGKKLDILRKNKAICFEMDIDHQMIKNTNNPCAWAFKYRSVIGFGKAFFVEDFQEKSKALNLITQHYGGSWYDFSEKEMEKVVIIKIEINGITGKKAGY
jgi:uncharacterized protein